MAKTQNRMTTLQSIHLNNHLVGLDDAGRQEIRTNSVAEMCKRLSTRLGFQVTENTFKTICKDLKIVYNARRTRPNGGELNLHALDARLRLVEKTIGIASQTDIDD